MTRKTTVALAVAIALAAGAFGAGMAIANHTSSHVTLSGGGFVGRKITTDTAAFQATGTSWKRVPNSGIAVTVPTGESRLVTAQFAGTGKCSNDNGFSCSMRIMAGNGSSTVEMYPKAGSFGYVLNGVGSTWEESIGMDRSRRFTGGTWTVWVEIRTGGDNYFTIFGWHFMVDVLR